MTRGLRALVPPDAARRLPVYGLYFALVLLYRGAASVAGLTLEVQVMEVWRGSLLVAASAGVVLAVYHVFRTLLEMPPTYAELAVRLRRRVLSWQFFERVGGILLLVLGTNLAFEAFAAFKISIPQFRAYALDLPLAGVDRFVHLGQDPWRWLHALPLRDHLTGLFDWVYVRWYDVLWLTSLSVLTLAPLDARLRFYVGHLLIWMVAGSAMAIPLASGGPVYFEHFGGDSERFASLIAYLDQAAPTARALQDRLWMAFTTPGRNLPFEGISAMPSLHVGFATYIALWAGGVHRWLGALGTLYAGAIMVASVHLGWHYAIDGYVGAASAWVCWYLSNRILERRPGPSSTRKSPPGD